MTRRSPLIAAGTLCGLVASALLVVGKAGW
jgi:hypothetical protein